MVRNQKKLSVKDFGEAIEVFLAQSTESQLRDVIRFWANDVSPLERQAFLTRLTASQKDCESNIVLGATLLSEIASVKSILRELANQEPNWDRFDGRDEDCMGDFGEHIASVRRFFEQAQTVFEQRDYAVSAKVYAELFEIFEIRNECDQGIRYYELDGIDFGEVSARYLRSVYECALYNQRAEQLLVAMKKVVELDFTRQHPCLKEIINIAVEPLSCFSEFLEEWIEVVRQKSGRRYDAWLREAVILRSGVAGIRELALGEGSARPRAYFDWLSILVSEGFFDEAIGAARNALHVLPAGLPIRAAVAEVLVTSGRHLNLHKVEMEGRWFSFETKPTLLKLLEMFERAIPEERLGLMCNAGESVRVHLKLQARREVLSDAWERDDIEDYADVRKSLLVHAHLLTGNVDAALKLAQVNNVLGWSDEDNAQPLCVAFCFVRACGGSLNSVPSSVRDFWRFVTRASLSRTGWFSDEEDDTQASYSALLDEVYERVLGMTVLSRDCVDWCFSVSEERVRAILSNQHRGAYGRAALLMFAMHETLQSMGRRDDAFQLLERIKQRFPRHSAFWSEFRALSKVV